MAISARNSSLAAEYSSLGHYHNRQLKEAHLQLSLLQTQDRFRSPDSVITVDLHGLLVADGVSNCREVLQTAKPGSVVKIITGVGNHSEGNKAKLLPAIRNFLAHSGYRFNQPKQGEFIVHLR